MAVVAHLVLEEAAVAVILLTMLAAEVVALATSVAVAVALRFLVQPLVAVVAPRLRLPAQPALHTSKVFKLVMGRWLLAGNNWCS